jgi:hypothetical protein
MPPTNKPATNEYDAETPEGLQRLSEIFPDAKDLILNGAPQKPSGDAPPPATAADPEPKPEAKPDAATSVPAQIEKPTFTKPEPKPVVEPKPEEQPKPEPEKPSSDKPTVSEAARKNFDNLKAQKDEAEARLKAIQDELEKARKERIDTKEYEELKRQNETLRKHVAAADVMLDPQFQAYFTEKEKAIQEQVGSYAENPELTESLMKVLRQPRSPQRTKHFESLLADAELSPVRQQVLAQFLTQADGLQAEKQKALENAEADLKRLQEQRRQVAEVQNREKERQRDEVFHMTAQGAQDVETGLEVFRANGDPNREAEVKQLMEQAKTIYTGKLSDAELAQNAFWAAAAPKYREAVVIQSQLITKLQKELESLRGAQPSIPPSTPAMNPKPKSYVDEVLGLMGH